MFNTVVWATDGSACSDHALELVRSIAERDHSDVHVVHVRELLATGGMAGPAALTDADAIEQRIRHQAQQLSEAGTRCEVHVVSASAGAVAKTIAKIADDAGAEVIIVGTRGYSALVGMLVGSVTQSLLHVAGCPVLAVPPAAVQADVSSATAVSG
jgi:nucleotide-binding universal stress UspA family protein